MLKSILGGLLVTWAVGGCADLTGTDTSSVRHDPRDLPNGLPQPNPSGAAATFNANDNKVDTTGDFFTSFGTNGRSCGSCHVPSDGWSIIPAHLQERFEQTGGLDPVFRTNDGSNSPDADVSTVDARRKAYSMLLTRGVIRVSVTPPATAEFSLTADDPYGYATQAHPSLFRRPLQSANLDFLSTVMWDGRETFADGPAPGGHADDSCLKPPFPNKCFRSVTFDLSDQAIGATLGHAQAMVPGLTPDQDAAIVAFEQGLYFAQSHHNGVGSLDNQGANGGPENVASVTTYFGINDNFGDYRTGLPFTADIFDIYNAWDGIAEANRAAIARGQALFNSKPITITGVGGLNNALGLPASFSGTCGTCHDAPNGGNHTVPAPLNIGIADASRRTPDMPLYTLTCNAAGAAAGHCVAGATVQSTDPGRALVTGLWADVGKFKGPTLRGIAARAPYFHNGSAADLDAVVQFYVDRFGINFTSQERSDLVAFLGSI
jgi:hypothetical protein